MLTGSGTPVHTGLGQPETKFSRLVTMGNRSPEPVDETMSGNQFHYKNKYEILFVCLVMFLKVRWL